MLNPNHPVTERFLSLLLIPLLLSMGVLGRACLCHHDDAGGMCSCVSEEATADCHGDMGDEDRCAPVTDCDPERDCCCFDDVPMDSSQLAEATSTITQSDPLLLCSVILATPALAGPLDFDAGSPLRSAMGASLVPWPERRPLFALFESYLC
jgi:hypothetical protein